MEEINLEDYRNKFDETCQGTVPVAIEIIFNSALFLFKNSKNLFSNSKEILEDLKIIVCHLGNGASISAVKMS